ncbi:MAG: aryl-sulfate sulfotransferase [Deltaproteobacteria bacterium]|nr:aryl-sulfate sulfotransferase [Deltaproteobacteria bacterium]
MKKIALAFVAVFVFSILLLIPVFAYQSHFGPTEVTYYDKTKAFNGYTLFSPFRARNTFLIDMEGNLVHSWERGGVEKYAYFLENGNMIWGLSTGRGNPARYQEVDWDGSVIWELQDTREGYTAHHDFQKIWNKKLKAYTLLMVSSREITHEQGIAAGCDPKLRENYRSVPDGVVEMDMKGNVVWEWNIFDHLIQDVDPTKENYVGKGKTIADYPGKMDANFGGGRAGDWIHTNSIDYNEELDQIAVNNSRQSEFYIIDHGGTFIPGDPKKNTELAASDAGDFLFRWGNPAVFDAGQGISADEYRISEGDQQTFFTHDIQWIRNGLPGAGNFLIFDNGERHLQCTYSTVYEINPYDGPMIYGIYVPQMEAGSKRGGESNQIAWKYKSENPCSFYARNISGAQRMPNGNTVICAGTWGQFFEVTKEGEVVWEYICPGTRAGIRKFIGDGDAYQNSTFRVYRYAADHPALKDRDLKPLGTITELAAQGKFGGLSEDIPEPRAPRERGRDKGGKGGKDGDKGGGKGGKK